MGNLKAADIERDIRALVAEILETEPDKIDSNASFTKDLGMDSMMALEVLAGVEKKYRIVIPEDLLTKFTNVNQTVSVIQDIVSKTK